MITGNRYGVVAIAVCGVFGIFVACSGSPAACSDPSVPCSAPPAQRITITLASAADLALIAVRDGVDAPWQTPEAVGPGRYEIEVHGPYTVEAVCVDMYGSITLEVSRMLDDPHDLDMSCLFTAALPVSHVMGKMVQSGTVALGMVSAFTKSDLSFDLKAHDGTFDLLAKTLFDDATNGRIAIRRDMVVAGATMVTPPIDVAGEGVSTIELPVTVMNLRPGEIANASAALVTRSTSMAFPPSPRPLVVRILPDAALQQSDNQYVTAGVGQGELGYRSIRRKLVPGGSTMYALPDPLDLQFAVIDGQFVATWRSLPKYDQLRFGAGQYDQVTSVIHYTDLSPSYVATTGITSARFDTDLPGYAPTWRIDFTKPWGRNCMARTSDPTGTEVSESYVDGDIYPSASADRSRPGMLGAALRMIGR